MNIAEDIAIVGGRIRVPCIFSICEGGPRQNLTKNLKKINLLDFDADLWKIDPQII